tara:strand:+ start:3728 stop:6145 length:2418 start_codon:yes stop_codon:yes gene_type:complete
MTQNITIFRNIKETDTPFYVNIDKILDRIKNGKSKDLVKNIRKEKDKSHRNELKKKLPAICFSGKFTNRKDSSLNEHSGFICLDFDGYEKQKTMISEKQKLTKDKYTYSVFVSPSGNGLKVIVKIPQDVENHINYFIALEKYYESKYFDKTCKNVSRVCYESYDPLLFLNKNSSVWDEVAEIEYKEFTSTDSPTIPITDENKIVEILVKWWTKKYPMTEGQRNQNVYVLAMAFNDYGVQPSLAGYILNQYATKDFNQKEIKRTIDSAYSNRQNFGTKYYEDDVAISKIKQQLRRGVPKKEIRQQFEDTAIGGDVVNAVIHKVEDENSKYIFWTKSDKGVVKIVHIEFKRFLEDKGFFKFCPEGSKNYVFVKRESNLVDHTSEKEIKDFVLSHLLTLDDISIYNYFADSVRFFREEFLTLLETIDIFFIEDTKHSAYLYYNNCAVEITKNSVKIMEYSDLEGYVWRDHIIDRKFKICEVGNCTYQTFVKNICGGEQEQKRIKTMESTIGFMLHAHKNLSYCPAIILNDEVITDTPEGGTGKGIFMKAISHMKKVVTIDGKSFAFERSFAYQLVSADTQILVFDDVKKYFDFERLFSVVTEGMTLEKKNKDAISIPFSKSPKIAITTNYAIKGSGNSFARRKWEVELSQHYNKNRTPLDEFGKLMFGDWDDPEWCQFDNYMIQNLQLYLGKGLLKSHSVNQEIRNLGVETSHEFLEWCGLIEGEMDNLLVAKNRKSYKQTLYVEFTSEYPDYAPKSKMSITRNRFYKWLVAYANYKFGCAPEEGRDRDGRWIRFRGKEELEVQGKLM